MAVLFSPSSFCVRVCDCTHFCWPGCLYRWQYKTMATARDDLLLRVPLRTAGHKDRDQLLQYIEEGQVGFEATLQGPYGTRRGTGMCEVSHTNVYMYPQVYFSWPAPYPNFNYVDINFGTWSIVFGDKTWGSEFYLSCKLHVIFYAVFFHVQFFMLTIQLQESEFPQ